MFTSWRKRPESPHPTNLSLADCKYFKCSDDVAFRQLGLPIHYDAVYDAVIRKLENLTSFTGYELINHLQALYWKFWESHLKYRGNFFKFVELILGTMPDLLEALGTTSKTLYRE